MTFETCYSCRKQGDPSDEEGGRWEFLPHSLPHYVCAACVRLEKEVEGPPDHVITDSLERSRGRGK